MRMTGAPPKAHVLHRFPLRPYALCSLKLNAAAGQPHEFAAQGTERTGCPVRNGVAYPTAGFAALLGAQAFRAWATMSRRPRAARSRAELC